MDCHTDEPNRRIAIRGPLNSGEPTDASRTLTFSKYGESLSITAPKVTQ